MVITGSGLLGVEFDVPAMANQSTFVITSGGNLATAYFPVSAGNTLVNLPDDLTNFSLMLTEIGDPSNSSTNFLELYNAGTSTIDFNIYPWYVSFNGSSSVQFTGSIASGAKFTVAYDGADFTPDLVSTLVGTGGTTSYLVSTYGDYMNGMAIDVYDGGAAGFDYTGKHAVRHYNIMSPNTTLTASEWVISAAENTDMTPGSHRSTLNWDGTPDSEWRSQNNWGEGFIPDAGHNVNIPNAGETTPVISFGDNAYCHDLTIGGAGIGLVIESDEFAGDGSLITYGTVSGTASVKRFLKADRFWYVTQPVTSATANVFLHTWLFTYDEASSNWDEFIEDETTPLVMMQGYGVWTSSINPWHFGWDPMGDTTTSFDGTLNSGPVNKPLSFGGNGWNFVGNPYVSAVNWDAAGWTKTGLATDAYSVWDGSTYGTYVAGSEIGTNGTTKYIPAGQGFFVQANASGSLGVSNAVRAHDGISFWKSEGNMMNRLSLTITNGEINDETVIYFNDEATTELDYSFDARKLLAPAAPQLYTMLGNDRMAINGFNNTAQTPSVTLGLNAPTTGEYTISVANIESFDAATPIFLEDQLTGQIINLKEVSSYSFSSDEGTSERFIVHFTEQQGIGDGPNTEMMNIFAADKKVYVDFDGSNGEIAIFNILGQEISRDDAQNGLNIISVPQGNAVYIVKVISDNTTVTKKVFVK
jgi:hypothetical protein